MGRPVVLIPDFGEEQWDVLNLGTHVRNARIFESPFLDGFKTDYWNTVPYFTLYGVMA